MIYNIDRRSVCGVISCPNKICFAATNIRNIVFIHECYLCLLLMMKWRRKIIECALSSRKVDPPITTFLIFVANALTYQNHTTQFFTTLYQCHEKDVINKTWPQKLIKWHQIKTWHQKLIKWHQFKTWPQKLIKLMPASVQSNSAQWSPI